MTKYLSNYCHVSANSVQVIRELSEKVLTASVGHCCHLHIV